MTPDRWNQVRSLFEQALRYQETDRHQYVETEAADDAELLQQVLAMLQGDLLETGPVDTPIPIRIGDAPLSPHTPTVGSVIGSWEIVEPIGEGGMGTVFRARRHDGAFEQEAALKVLSDLPDKDSVSRFASERQILARLAHPGIARLLDGGTTPEGAPYLVMELVEGLPIDAFARGNDLDSRACIGLIRQIGEAVAHAHHHLIVHGDIKPQNVLVDTEGRPRLLDFGIARVLGHQDGPGDSVYLTPGYASPERAAGKPLTTGADVYSLGAMLDRLLALAAPNKSSGDLMAVIRCATAPDPACRYQEVGNLCDDLRRVVEYRPVTARPRSLIRHLACFALRNRLVTALTITIVSLLVASTVVATRLAASARIERDAARAARAEMAAQRDHAASEAETARLAASFLTDNLLASRRLEPSERDRLRAATLRQAARVRRQFAEDVHMQANLLDALAKTLTRIGCDSDAEAIVREVLEVRRTTFGPASCETALSMQSLGELLFERREFDAALDEFRSAYAIHHDNPSAVHGDLATAANNVAACLRALGRKKEAEELHMEALALRERDGRISLPVAESLNNLGVLAIDDKDYARAQTLLSEAAHIRHSILGINTPLSLQTTMNLASVYWYAGERGEAIGTLQAAASALRNLHGAGDRLLLKVLRNLAGMELMDGKVDDGLTNATEAKTVLKRLGLTESREALPVQQLVARAYKDAGRHEAAAKIQQQALALMQRITPNDKIAILETRIDLAMCLVESKNYAAASTILTRLDNQSSTELHGHSCLVTSALATCKAAAGREARARELATKSLPNLVRRLGTDHHLVRRTKWIAKFGRLPGN